MFSSKKILAASFERGNKMAKNTDLNPTKVLISYDKTLIVYQDQLSEYPEIEGPFNCAGLSDCNTFVYGVSYDNTVSVWATQALLSKRFDPLVVYKENTPKEKMTFYYEGHTYAILFSPLECSITRSRFDERPWDSESVDKRRFEEGQALLKQLCPSDDENDEDIVIRLTSCDPQRCKNIVRFNYSTNDFDTISLKYGFKSYSVFKIK